MFRYTAFGLTFESEIELPELAVSINVDIDVIIKFGKVPDFISEVDVLQKLNAVVGEKEYLFKFFDKVHYYATNGTIITIEAFDNVEPSTIRCFLFTNVIPALLYQRQMIVINASAIINKKDNRVVLICGESGTGKSTIAATFEQNGYQILSDNPCVLQIDLKNKIDVIAGCSTKQLWPDSVNYLSLSKEKRLGFVRDGINKQLFKLDISTKNNQKYELGNIFILSNTRTENTASVKLLSRLHSFINLEQKIYKPQYAISIAQKSTLFNHLSIVCNATPVYEYKTLISRFDSNVVYKNIINYL